jgi:anti-sigma regulatory factor (Ser/Thr protein kinase)
MLRMSTALPRSVEAPARARALCARACSDWHLEPLADVCMLLASELVTNAVTHGSGSVELEIRSDGRRLVVAVGQEGHVPELPEPRMSAPDAMTGRGLAIVAELATRWGADVDERGTTVWFELAAPHDDVLP